MERLLYTDIVLWLPIIFAEAEDFPPTICRETRERKVFKVDLINQHPG